MLLTYMHVLLQLHMIEVLNFNNDDVGCYIVKLDLTALLKNDAQN
jgi:hypothetical protein